MKNTPDYYRAAWKRWKEIQDRIILHHHYRYDATNQAAKQTLLRMLKFIQSEMAHANTMYWRLTPREELPAFQAADAMRSH